MPVRRVAALRILALSTILAALPLVRATGAAGQAAPAGPFSTLRAPAAAAAGVAATTRGPGGGPVQGAATASPGDVESIDAIIAAVYDVISGSTSDARDWDRFRSLFHPDARLMPMGTTPGRPEGAAVRFITVEDYVRQAERSMQRVGFWETEIHRITERFANMAHVLSTYETRRDRDDAEPAQRGINSFQLQFDGERWWILSIYWQAETGDKPIPDRYLGGS